MKQTPLSRRELACHCHWNTRWLLRKQAFLIVIYLLFASLPLFAQVKTVSGTVHDDKGQPVSGASIMIRGTSKGITSGSDGKFTIQAADNAMLVISYVGFATQEIALNGQSELNVQLATTSQNLNSIVVVAYGTTTKKTSTGAVQSVSQKELQDIPVAQVTQKLQGKLAGVQINQTSGKPGQGMQVRIRGQASILAGSSPLYVVDGFPIVGDISNINPDEIENISVLKDAA